MVDEELERKGLWATLAALTVAVGALTYQLYQVTKLSHTLTDIMMEHINSDFQKDVDEAFENIVDNFDE